MRILYIQSAELIPYALHTFKTMGYEVDVFTGNEKSISKSTPQLGKVLDRTLAKVKDGYYDLAFSFNFFHVISDTCQKHKLIYISWIYDSPQAELFHPALNNSNNAIFLFDKCLFHRMKAFGEANLYYRPLAADTEGIAGVGITLEDEKKYSGDIAFVGQMYEENTYNRLFQDMPESLKQEFQFYLQEHSCDWKSEKTWPKVSGEAVEYLYGLSAEGAKLAYRMPLEEYYGTILLSRKQAEIERRLALYRLSLMHPVRVFTNSRLNPPKLEKGEVLPPVDYGTEMRKVFHLSKINLNFTLPSIESGVPLRVMDIVSVGGFCLSNAQNEIGELFEVGKEIEVFHDMEELLWKTLYYLRHEDERIEIAIRGYQKAASMYSYRHALKEMLSVAEALKEREQI